MTRVAYWSVIVAFALIVLRLFIPIPGLSYAALAVILAGWVTVGERAGAFRRRVRGPVDRPLSAQQVMRNTRAALPEEYREWFDWTAELAGFAPWERAWIARSPKPRLIDFSLTKISDSHGIEESTPANLPGGGRVSYGPGTGWELEGDMWVRRAQ